MTNPKQDTSAEKWLPLERAAQRYGHKTTRAFREWVKRHQLPYRKLGAKLFYCPEEIDRAIEQAKLSASTPESRQDAAERALAKIGRA